MSLLAPLLVVLLVAACADGAVRRAEARAALDEQAEEWARYGFGSERE
jgi:hypothetical protein